MPFLLPVLFGFAMGTTGNSGSKYDKKTLEAIYYMNLYNALRRDEKLEGKYEHEMEEHEPVTQQFEHADYGTYRRRK